MLKLEISKQETTISLVATKRWLFLKKLPFSLPSLFYQKVGQYHSNGHLPVASFLWATCLLLVDSFILDYYCEGKEGKQAQPPSC